VERGETAHDMMQVQFVEIETDMSDARRAFDDRTCPQPAWPSIRRCSQTGQMQLQGGPGG